MPGPVFTTRLVGHVKVGFSKSVTVTVNEQVTWLLDASVAVQLTGVVPLRNCVPDAGVHATVAAPQSSLATTANCTVREHWPGAVFVVIFGPQETLTGVQFTPTLFWQVLPQPLALVMVKVRVKEAVPAVTFTVWLLLEPTIVPLPEIVH